MTSHYLQSVKKQFRYYKSLGERSFSQIGDKDLFWQAHPDSNSIAIIVHHLSGNMLSRWTNFLTEDGEKEWRQRDLEFEDVIHSRAELLKKWKEGWDCLFQALETINEDNFNQEILIRNQPHSVVEAINRQLAHYAYHIGEIVFISKMRKGKDWVSLTIPKGQSAAFNADKFST